MSALVSISELTLLFRFLFFFELCFFCFLSFFTSLLISRSNFANLARFAFFFVFFASKFNENVPGITSLIPNSTLDATYFAIGSSRACRSASRIKFPPIESGHSRSPARCPYALQRQHCITLTSMPMGSHNPLEGAFFKNSRAL